MAIPDLLMLGIIGLLGFLCQLLAWRIKLPAILFLLLTGILLGPVAGLLKPDALFGGDFLFSFISLCVAIILFEGSLTLKLSELKDIGSAVRNLVSYGALLNASITTVAVHYFTSLSWSLSALFGAIMVVTGPTVIMPMLQSVRPNRMIARTLRWESIIIDPLGALFAVLVFEWIVAQQQGTELLHVAIVFGETVLTGALFGILMGYCFGLLLRHHIIPEFLHNFAAIAFVAGTFSVSNTIMHESGLLAVTLMGIWLTNMRGVHTRDILSFKESLTLMFVSVLFIILSARINVDSLLELGWGAVAVLLVMQLLARPAKVFACTPGSNFSFKERLFLAWVGPRGIVAAAVTAVFAIKLEALSMDNADLLVPLAFSVIIGTVLIQGVTARPLAKWLKVNAPATQGTLIIGANPVAIAIAKALKSAGIETIVCDTRWQDISAARMEGLETYYGNPISDHADRHLDISGFGCMLGLSYYHSANTTAALRFREDFGVRNIFTLAAADETDAHDKHRVSEFYRGHILFSNDVTYQKLYRIVLQDDQVKNTALSDTYRYEQWLVDNSELAIPLFALDTSNRLHWFTSEKEFTPQPGWRLFSLNTVLV